jgi:nucleoside-diphosphate-sugar epimerase
MARYTILGGSGFVGSRLGRLLSSKGESCYVPSRGEEGVFEQDLGLVFYCIGLTADYAAKPFQTVEAHVTYLARILERARFDRLVYLSSTRLYDSLEGGRGEEGSDLKLNPGNPRHLYDISKAMGENLCLSASSGKAAVARLSCVYDDADDAPGFLSELLQRVRRERAFGLESSSGFSRDYVFVDDVTAALKAIVDSESTGIFNVASGENVSNGDLIDFLNKRSCSIALSRKSERQAPAISDISRIRSLGITPTPVLDYLGNFMRGIQ